MFGIDFRVENEKIKLIILEIVEFHLFIVHFIQTNVIRGLLQAANIDRSNCLAREYTCIGVKNMVSLKW